MIGLLWATALGAVSLSAIGDDIREPRCAPAWLSKAELGRLLETETASASLDAITLDVADCQRAPDDLIVKVFRSGELYPIERNVFLGGITPSIRLRTLALVVVECLAEDAPSFDGDDWQSAAAVRTSSRAVRVTESRPVAPSLASPTVEAAFATRFAPNYGTVALGARLMTTFAAGASFLRLIVDAGVEGARVSTRVGEVRIALASARLTSPLMLSDGLIRFGLGPSIEAGWAWTSGHAKVPAVATGNAGVVLFVVGAAAAASANVSRHLVLCARFDLGAVVRGVEATVDGEPRAGIGGLLVGLQLGIGWEI